MRAARVLDEEPRAGNVFDKYGSRNPIVRGLMAGFYRGLFELLGQIPPPHTVLEVGCGEGQVTAKLAQRFPSARVVGTDRSATILAKAREFHRGPEFRVMSVYDAGGSGPWELVVACEVLEHLAEPARALDALYRAAAGHVLVSVPREPLWRVLNVLRGRYWPALGNTPGHVQHWSRATLIAFLRERLDIVGIRMPVPWIQVLGRPHRRRTP